MIAPIAFLHSTEQHISHFDQLMAELAPDIPTDHHVRKDLLDAAIIAGGLEGDTRRDAAECLLALASQGAPVVLCTCSTLGPAADTADKLSDAGILRLDRPMMQAAVQKGSRLLLAACLETTLGPSRQLLEQTAREAGVEPTIRLLRLFELWPVFERGDMVAFARGLALTLEREVADADAVVLAQASMAVAVEVFPDLPVPILTSPRSGLEAAVTAHRKATGRG